MPEPLRHRTLWQAIGVALILFVVYQSLTPAPVDMELGEGNRYGHLLAYGSLMGWHAHLHLRRGTRIGYALGFIAMGIALEFIQGATGYRTTDPLDALANTTGVGIGWLLAPPRLPNLLSIAERILDRRRQS